MATTAIARMDEETIGQKSALSNLYIQRNSVCFIYRLPTETLGVIFVHCACDYYNEHSGHRIPIAPSWVNVSYVSRHWRNVALNCPTLWTYLFITSPRWTEELLARSKQASLKLYVTPDRRDNGSRELCFVEQVMNHVERIQELRLQFPFAFNAIGYQFLSKLSSGRAPRLQKLEISADGTPSNWTSVLFDGDTPALRTLEFIDLPVPWYSFKLNGLTTLSLWDVPARFQQNTVEFLAMLSCMQDLMHLYLHDALASAAGFLSRTAIHTSQKINLPHLSHFSIIAPFSTVIALLSCVNIPLKTEVRLTCRPERDPSFRDYTSISSLLAQRFGMSEQQVLSGPTIRSLVIEYTEWGGAKLTCSASERDCDPSVSISHRVWGCSIPLQIVLRQFLRLDRDRIINDICCSIPLTNVQSVHIRDPPFFSALWKHALGHLQDLRYIKLSHGHMPGLASILSLTSHDCTENQGGHADQGPSRIFAPALEELELDDIIFSTELKGAHMYPLAADVQSLCDALSTRKAPRGRLTMTGCTERNSDRQEKKLDMAGWWEGGCFHVVDKHDSDTP